SLLWTRVSPVGAERRRVHVVVGDEEPGTAVGVDTDVVPDVVSADVLAEHLAQGDDRARVKHAFPVVTGTRAVAEVDRRVRAEARLVRGIRARVEGDVAGIGVGRR